MSFFRRNNLDYDPKEFPRYRELFPQPRSLFAKMLDCRPSIISFMAANWNILVIICGIIAEFFTMINYNLWMIPTAVRWLINEFKTADGCNMTHGALLLFWMYRTGYSFSFVLWDLAKWLYQQWVPFYASVWLRRIYWVGSVIAYIYFSIPAIFNAISMLIISAAIGIILLQISLYLYSICPCPDWLRRPEPEPRDPRCVGFNEPLPFQVRFSNPPSPKTPKTPSPIIPARAFSWSSPPSPSSINRIPFYTLTSPENLSVKPNPISTIKPPGAAYVKRQPFSSTKPPGAAYVKPKPTSSLKPPGASYVKVSPKAKHYLASNGIIPERLAPKRSTNFQRLSRARNVLTPEGRNDPNVITSYHQNRPINNELKNQWLAGTLSSAERELAQMSSEAQRLKTLIAQFYKKSCAATQMASISPTTALLPRPEMAVIKGDNAREKLRFKALLAEYPPEIENIVTYIQQSHPRVRDSLTGLASRIDADDQSPVACAMRADYIDCQEKLTRIVRIIERAQSSVDNSKQRCARRIEELSDEIARLDSIDLSHKKLKMRAYSP
ncbi:hypothetical protein N0V84_005461 [Fusarium piperis]|uniref:Uncharacterized protein n=1 Tax=Fusarium piperis TaxID=1435070 RepID=A0A9W9BQK5_9HYPO|nr:hypothetical protein N0V84_005461 [Fusarium piperis]